MYSEITQTVKTADERDLMLSEIESLKSALFETKNGGIENALRANVRASVASFLRKGMEGKNASGYLDGLIRELKGLEELKLILAIEPTENMIDTIYSWMISNSLGNVILNIEVDKRIIAGAQISFRGKYFDGSLSDLVDSVLTSKK